VLNNVQNAEARRTFVGNAVYPVILNVFGNDQTLAGKLTGMIIDENAVNIALLLQDQNYLS
jgi:hypothetical protein